MRKALIYIICLLLLIYVLLTLLVSKGYILNLQVFINFNLIPLVFWMFVILAGLRVIMADIGFLKLGGVLIMATAFIILVTQLSYTNIKYESFNNENYELIVSVSENSDYHSVSVYKNVNLIYSEYLDTISVTVQYTISYEIVDDTFIVHKCTEVSCIDEIVELE